VHAGDGTYTEPQVGPQPASVGIVNVSLIIMGMAAALALCAGLTWYRLVRSTRALRKEEEDAVSQEADSQEAVSQEAAAVGEHKNAVVPLI
jgi:hypothetical protein